MKRISKSCLLLLLCALMPTGAILGQDVALLDGEDKAYVQKAMPRLLSSYRNSTFFADGKFVRNLRGGKLLKAKNITHLFVNPAGTTFAVVSQGKKTVGVYDLWKKNQKVGVVKMSKAITACCFSADGSRFYVVDETGVLGIFGGTNLKLLDGYLLPFVPTQMLVSPNGQLLAMTNGTSVAIIDTGSKATLSEPVVQGRVNDICFSADSRDLAILLEDGNMYTLDTRSFLQLHSVGALGEARACAFHPGGKYMAVVTGDARVLLVNLLDNNDRLYVEAPEGGVTEAYFTTEERGTVWLVYNTANSIHYKQVSELAPNYTQLMEEEVMNLMAEWERRMPEEPMEAWQMRVNDETRMAQRLYFEEMVTTRMAEQTMNLEELTFSSYNPEMEMMALDFEGMDPIYIDVPKQDVGFFTSPSDVEVRNPVYTLDANDQFQLVYADIYNKQTGKTYTFDNRERKSLDYLAEDNGFIPMEYVQQSGQEAIRLEAMKNQVVTNAMQENALTNHTHISVSTQQIPATDAFGRQVINYEVSFGYTVDARFLQSEDFAPGRYRADQSAAAQTMLKIISEAMQTDFAQYVKPGKKVIVKITGSADATPIKGAIPYGGEYGNYTFESVWQDDIKTAITVNKASGITSNEQLAFLRAMGMKWAIQRDVAGLDAMDVQFKTYIEQGKGVGGQFRRIRVDFTFLNAFDN